MTTAVQPCQTTFTLAQARVRARGAYAYVKRCLHAEPLRRVTEDGRGVDDVKEKRHICGQENRSARNVCRHADNLVPAPAQKAHQRRTKSTRKPHTLTKATHPDWLTRTLTGWRVYGLCYSSSRSLLWTNRSLLCTSRSLFPRVYGLCSSSLPSAHIFLLKPLSPLTSYPYPPTMC